MIIETIKCNAENEQNHVEYTYNLIQSELEIYMHGEKRVIDAYGVEVESKVKDKNSAVNEYKEEVKYITPYRYKGSEFLKLLKNNKVSPIHLLDITEEYIEEYYGDFDEAAQAVAN